MAVRVLKKKNSYSDDFLCIEQSLLVIYEYPGMIVSFPTVHVTADSITSLDRKSRVLGENGSAGIAGSFGNDAKVHTFLYLIKLINSLMQLRSLFIYLSS
jgi:hypothetical protein